MIRFLNVSRLCLQRGTQLRPSGRVKRSPFSLVSCHSSPQLLCSEYGHSTSHVVLSSSASILWTFRTINRYIHIAYTLQTAYLLPVRAYSYKKRAWHYFLFDLCYYCTILNLVYLWITPANPAMWVACYCLSHGSLASAVITWRNSLVFHDFDKVTSLFIHVYPPLVFTVIR